MSHHASGPEFGFPRGDARLDMTDLYAFPKPGDPGKSILVLNVHPSVGVNPPGPRGQGWTAPRSAGRVPVPWPPARLAAAPRGVGRLAEEKRRLARWITGHGLPRQRKSLWCSIPSISDRSDPKRSKSPSNIVVCVTPIFPS